MSNRLYINAVHLRYLRTQPGGDGELYGFLVGDDHEQYEVLDLPSEIDIPDTLEGFIRHCRENDHSSVWGLLAEHASAERGVTMDGSHTDAAELKRLMDLVADEEEGGHG